MVNQNHDHEEDVEQNTSTSSQISELGASAGKLILKLFGPLTDEVGQYLADNFRQWRWKRENFEKIAERHEAEKKARGIHEDSLASVTETEAYRLTDACSFEDNEMVQELWAGLITSVMDPNTKTGMTRAFIEILKAIGPVETGLLLVLHELNRSTEHALTMEELKRLEALASHLYRKFSESEQEIAIQNLFRLRCIGLRTGRNLSQNQTRLGLPIGVRATEAAPTYESFAKVADYLESLIMVGTGTVSYKQSLPLSSPFMGRPFPETKFEFTRLGEFLMSLCMTEAIQQEVSRKTRA